MNKFKQAPLFTDQIGKVAPSSRSKAMAGNKTDWQLTKNIGGMSVAKVPIINKPFGATLQNICANNELWEIVLIRQSNLYLNQ